MTGLIPTNRIEGNPLTLPEVRAVVEAFRADPAGK
jgi:hypothetical protein